MATPGVGIASLGSSFSSLPTLASASSLPNLPSDLSSLPAVDETASAAAGDSKMTASSAIQTSQPVGFSTGAVSRAPTPEEAPAQTVAPATLQRLQRLQRLQVNKSTVGGSGAKAGAPTAQKTVKKRTGRRKKPVDPSAVHKPPPLGPWSKEEIAQLQKLVEEHGEGNWDAKAQAMGNGRTAKALHTRWLRQTGRIIDMPRGQNNLLNHKLTSTDVNIQQAILEKSSYLLPALSGSLAAAFGMQDHEGEGQRGSNVS